MTVKINVGLDVSRDFLVQVLGGYGRTCCPSATLKIVAEAMDLTAELCGARQTEANHLCEVANQLRALSVATRAREDAMYATEKG